MSDSGAADRVGDGLSPRAAAVVPRAHRAGCEASVPIDQLLLPVLRSASRGIALITGEHGGGKTTALQHLHAVLPAVAPVTLYDADELAEAQRAAKAGMVVLTAVDAPVDGKFIEVFELSPWTLDDCLEYLVALHREQCASVVSRLERDPSLSLLNGSPRLLSVVMDAMAGDPTVQTSRDVLRHHARQIIPPGAARDRLMREGPAYAPLDHEQLRWWRHKLVREVCTADWIVGQLCEGIVPDQLYHMADRAYLIPQIANAVQHEPAAIDCLGRFVQAHKRSPAVAMVASILLAVDPDWRPADGRGLNLCRAILEGAKWAGVDLLGCSFMNANLSRAELDGADLSHVNLHRADLTGASLRGARLKKTQFQCANLFSADLSGVQVRFF
jgi:energy-coupling factor transporter ATP-binding protein EcfA2